MTYDDSIPMPEGAFSTDTKPVHMAQVPVRIVWSWPQRGIDHAVYEDDPATPEKWSGYIHAPRKPDPVFLAMGHDTTDGHPFYERLAWHLHRFWWEEGNGACDSNRRRIPACEPDEPEALESTNRECTHEIVIHRIEPIGVAVGALNLDIPCGCLAESSAECYRLLAFAEGFCECWNCHTADLIERL